MELVRKKLPWPMLGLMMSYPVVFGLDTNPVGSLVLVDVFGVEIGMGFTVVLLLLLDD